MGKMAKKLAQNWDLGTFSYFFGDFFPNFWGRPKPVFFLFFLFRAGGPKWGLYQVNRIARTVLDLQARI